jgi:hypothetical protein
MMVTGWADRYGLERHTGVELQGGGNPRADPEERERDDQKPAQHRPAELGHEAQYTPSPYMTQASLR